MPDTVVTIPGVGDVAFPDTMTPAQIDAAAKKLYDEAQPKPRSWTDTAVDALPMVGGTVGGILGGLSGIPTLGLGSVPGAITGATTLGAGGEALKQLINRSRGVEAPASPLDAAKDIALQGGIQGGAEAVGGLVTKGLTTGANAVYRGYLKPSLAGNKLAKAGQIVQTALDEALPITRGGTQKAQRVISELRAKVDDIIASTPGVIDLKQLADRVRGFARQRYFKPGADLTDYQQALGVADKLDMHPALGLPPGARPTRVDVPLTTANETKRALDTSIKEAGFGVPTGAKKTTEKFARTALKQGLETKAPDIGPLNARESKLIDAAQAIAKAVEREANQSKLYGVKTLAALGGGGAAGAASGDPYVGAAVSMAGRRLLETDAMSWTSILAHRFAKELGVGMSSALRLAEYVTKSPTTSPRE